METWVLIFSFSFGLGSWEIKDFGLIFPDKKPVHRVIKVEGVFSSREACSNALLAIAAKMLQKTDLEIERDDIGSFDYFKIKHEKYKGVMFFNELQLDIITDTSPPRPDFIVNEERYECLNQ